MGMDQIKTCGYVSTKIICGMSSFVISKERERKGGERIRMSVDKFLNSQGAEYAPFPDEIIYYGKPGDIYELAEAFK